ncbi:MAG: tripartite tricarboxylate transporter permease [Candidatus Binatia bacterium]
MLEVFFQAPLVVLQPAIFGAMLLGVAIGTFVAITPQGLGLPLAYALLVPIVIQFDPYIAIALLLGMDTVTNTGNTFLPVLFSIPGGAGAQAIILDGYPMGQKGEAKRALAAGFTASILGGLLGIVIMGITIPLLSSIVMLIGSPELLVLVIWGISTVALLAGPQPIKGLIAGVFGLSLTMVGVDPNTAVPRYMMGHYYFIDGIPLTIIALGIFAIPACLELAVRKVGVEQQSAPLGHGVLEGIKDTFRNWWLVIRCSVIGVIIGATPGLGSVVTDWIAYAHAAQTCKGARDTFGKGDVRGVIAPDTTNSSKDGGELIPTLAFGVPGSTTNAFFMLALIIMGITPGPSLLEKRMDLVFFMVWVMTYAAVIGGLVCLAFIPQMAKIATLRYSVLVPIILGASFLGAYVSTRDMMDLVLLFIFGTVGVIMKRYGYPRPPVLLGAVLGGLMEKYLFISVSAYGLGFLMRPGVMILLPLVVIGLIFAILARRSQVKLSEGSAE